MTLTFLFSSQVSSQDANPVIRSKLKPLVENDRLPSVLDGLEVSIEANRAQLQVADGIKLSLSISNLSAASISFRAPKDFLHLSIANSDGYPVQLPPVPTWPFICTKGEQNRVAQEKVYDERRPIHVTNIQLDDPDSRNDVANRVIKLAPGDTCRVTLSITKIVADPKHYAKQIVERSNNPEAPIIEPWPPESMAIPAGNYTIRILLSLVSPPPATSNITLQSKAMKISLGSP
jgi:hypothetical protein